MVEYAKHQIEAISYQQVHPYSICAMQTGVGKTLTTIGSMLVNLKNKKLDKCIFVCTKGSIGEVLNDFNKFYNFQPKVLNNQEDIEDFFKNEHTIALTRYEKLKFFDKEFIRHQSHFHKIGMWFDEAQRCKNNTTIAHEKAYMLRKYCRAFHLVTATPIMSSLDDLWGLMHLVNQEVLGDYDEFCNQYYYRVLVPHPTKVHRRKTCPTCKWPLHYKDGWDYCSNPYCKSIETPNGFIPYRTQIMSIWNLVEYKNVEILANKLKDYMFCYFPKQDIQYKIHNFDMSEETLIKYTNISKDLINENKETDPTPFATRMLEIQYVVDRCQEKKDELLKLANELKEKGFVLYTSLYSMTGSNDSTTTLDEILKVLDKVENLEVRTYSGKDEDNDRDQNKKWFQEDCRNKCLIITEAGGASLNLQVTNEFIFYTIPFGFGKISQALGRIVRLFSKYKTFNVHVIQARKSIDTYKFLLFVMMSDLINKIMNNNLIDLKKPINYNSDLKAMIRGQFVWKNCKAFENYLKTNDI